MGRLQMDEGRRIYLERIIHTTKARRLNRDDDDGTEGVERLKGRRKLARNFTSKQNLKCLPRTTPEPEPLCRPSIFCRLYDSAATSASHHFGSIEGRFKSRPLFAVRMVLRPAIEQNRFPLEHLSNGFMADSDRPGERELNGAVRLPRGGLTSTALSRADFSYGRI